MSEPVLLPLISLPSSADVGKLCASPNEAYPAKGILR